MNKNYSCKWLCSTWILKQSNSSRFPRAKKIKLAFEKQIILKMKSVHSFWRDASECVHVKQIAHQVDRGTGWMPKDMNSTFSFSKNKLSPKQQKACTDKPIPQALFQALQVPTWYEKFSGDQCWACLEDLHFFG